MADSKKEKCRQQIDRYRSSRGAVAVFLAIILIPCIVVASVFVDVSRVQYSKMEAESAADLALHSMLSNYDTVLADYYGVVASCQNVDEFLTKSEKYFCGMMRNAGMDEGADLFADYILAFRNGDTSDFLKSTILEDVEVKPVDNSSPGQNPALMEDAIVEFMKYRGVYYLGKRYVEMVKRLAHMEGVWKAVDGIDSNDDMANAKEDYGEAESELLKQAFYTYLAIRNYDIDQISEQIPSQQKYTDIENKLKLIRQDLYSVTDLITKYYAGTQGIYVVEFPTIGKNAYTSTVTKDRYKVVEGSNTKYILTVAAYNKLVEDLNDDCAGYLQQVNNAANNITNACAGVSFNTGTNEALYCMEICRILNDHKTDINAINNAMGGLMYMYAEVKAALETEPETNEAGTSLLPADYKDVLRSWMNDIDTCWSNYLRPDPEYNHGTVPYNELRYTYYDRAGARTTVSKVQNRSYTFDSLAFGAGKTVGTFATATNSYLINYKKKLNTRRDELKTIMKGGSFTFKQNGRAYTCKSLSKLKDLADDKSDKLEEWRDLAFSQDSDYAKADQEEITKIDTLTQNGGEGVGDTSEKMAIKIDGQSVDDLKTRLEKIDKDLKDCYEAMDQIKYGGTAVSFLGSADDYINKACASVVPRTGLSMSLTENETAAQGYANRLITPAETELYKAPSINTSDVLGNDPDVSKEHGNMPELYEYLYGIFHLKENDATDNTEKAEGKLKEFKDKASEAKKGIKEMDSQAKSEKGSSITDGHGGGMNALSVVSGVFTTLKNLLEDKGEGLGENVRDKAYVTEYVFDMFTWATYNNEGRYKLAGNVSCKDYPYLSQASGWGENNITDPKRYADQTLTNKTFNKDTLDKAFLGEIEYILYGKPSFEENVGKAYSDIFTIRELLDVTSGFILFWGPKTATGKCINMIANSIATATYGIIPAILTKSVIILALSTMEACNDLEYLKKGVPVKVYKSDAEDWVFSLDNNNWEEVTPPDANEKENGAPEDEHGMYYSDYLYLFMLIETASSDYDSMLLRVGDVMEANINQAGHEGYELDNAVMYYHLTAKLQVKPLLLDMNIINAYKDVDLDEFKESEVWRSYKIDVTRGYS